MAAIAFGLIGFLVVVPRVDAGSCHVCSGPAKADFANDRHRRQSPIANQSIIANRSQSILYGNRQYVLGVLLASRAGTIFDYEKVLPAIEIAVEKANAYILPQIDVRLNLIRASYGNSCSSDGASGKAAEFVRDVNDTELVAFVGPACSDAVDHVARLSAYLNVTTITGLGDERQFVDKTHFGTLTRFAYCQCRLRRVVSAMLDRFNWTHVSILYDMNDYFSKTIGQSIDEGLREPAVGARLNMTPFVESFESSLRPDYEAMLRRASEDARIIILSVTGDILRKFMLAASRLQMTLGDWVFVDVELFPSYMFGNKHWRRNDSFDKIAQDAYRSLIRIAINENKTGPGHKAFVDEVRRRSRQQFGDNVFQPGEEVNFFIGAFHDAIIVLAEVLKIAILKGIKPWDGNAVKSYFRRWWSSEYLVTGDIHINANNDRDTEYLYLDMDNDRGEFVPVARYDAVAGGFNQLPDTSIDWPSGYPPPDVPACGFRNDNEICKTASREALQWATIGALGSALCAMVAVFFLYKRRKEKQMVMQSNWRISWNDLHKRPLMLGSMRSLGGSVDANATRPSTAMSMKSSKQGLHVEAAFYQGALVALKRCTFSQCDTNSRILSSADKALLLEMNKWKNLIHDNIVRIAGACVEAPNQCLITEYCMRGSVEDLIGNDRFDLDRNFQLSILSDIANGLQHMHKNLRIAHGRLTSSNCLVDARFVIKLSDWHMSFLTKPEHSQHKIEEKMLYQAPEVLRQELRRSPQADIFSFGITALEVLKKEQPYATERETMEIKDIVNKVSIWRFGSLPFRPELKSLPWDTMQRLIASCLEEIPSARPTVSEISRALRSENKGKRLNILENLLMRMEEYTSNLETMVQERTEQLVEEKKKMQHLLFELLPPPIASQLIEVGYVKPEAYDSVTIYFSDIVGFTSLSAESAPMEVVQLLNDLYTCFDDILSNYSVYKVETIGDAYMVVSGLPTRNGIEHSRQISRMALALLSAVKSFRVHHRPNHMLKLRIGLHSGSCVAGVVGLKMPRYCLFGDTVNTASRMESNGEALKIHVSKSTKDLLDTFGTFELVERGEVEMKGKGIQRTFWLLSEKDYQESKI